MTQVLIDRATLEQLAGVNLHTIMDALEMQRKHIEWMGSANPLNKAAIVEVKKLLGCSALTISAALANAEPTGCTWTQDPDFEMGDTYDSSCGEKWSFIDGGPTENRVRFCQGCGKPVKLIKEQP